MRGRRCGGGWKRARHFLTIRRHEGSMHAARILRSRRLLPLMLLVLGFAIIPVLSWWLMFLSWGKIMLPVAGIATACLYGAAGSMGLLLFGPRPAALPVGIALVAALAWGVPSIVNARVDAAALAASAGDREPRGGIGPYRAIAILEPRETTLGLYTESDCALPCQKLLFSGRARAVLRGPAPVGGDPASARGLTRYSIERRARCPAAAIPQGNEFFADERRESARITDRIAAGECLIAAPALIGDADIVAMKHDAASELIQAARMRAGPIAAWRSTIHARADGRWLLMARATPVAYSRLVAPLRLRGNEIAGFIPVSQEARTDAVVSNGMIERVLRL